MSNDIRIRNAAVWGVCFMAAAVYFLTVPYIENMFSDVIARFFVLELAIFLFTLTFVLHIKGFVYLGRKVGSFFLVRSAQAMIVALVLVEVLVMANILFVTDNDPELARFTDAFIGLFAFLFIAAALSYGVAIARLYKRLGVFAVGSAFIGLSFVFMWQPWPAILLFIPSTILFFRESR